jgi:hypothetical protein
MPIKIEDFDGKRPKIDVVSLQSDKVNAKHHVNDADVVPSKYIYG